MVWNKIVKNGSIFKCPSNSSVAMWSPMLVDRGQLHAGLQYCI